MMFWIWSDSTNSIEVHVRITLWIYWLSVICIGELFRVFGHDVLNWFRFYKFYKKAWLNNTIGILVMSDPYIGEVFRITLQEDDPVSWGRRIHCLHPW